MIDYYVVGICEKCGMVETNLSSESCTMKHHLQLGKTSILGNGVN